MLCSVLCLASVSDAADDQMSGFVLVILVSVSVSAVPIYASVWVSTSVSISVSLVVSVSRLVGGFSFDFDVGYRSCDSSG